jgi:hypothetical protein
MRLGDFCTPRSSFSSSLPLYSGRILLSLGILLSAHIYRRGTDTDLQKTSRDRYPASPFGAVTGPTESIYHVIAKHCCVTSLRMSKLHRRRKHCCCIVGRVCVAGVVSQWICVSQYLYMCVCVCVRTGALQFSMQVHRLLVAPPLSPCFM